MSIKSLIAVSAFLGFSSSQPVTPCTTNQECLEDPDGNDFCCATFEVMDILDHPSGEYNWGYIANNFGGDQPDTGEKFSICSSREYNAQLEYETKGTDGIITYYQDMKNVYENQKGFKEAVLEAGIDNFDGYITEYLLSDQETLSTFLVKPTCMDGKRVFLKDSA